MFLLLVLLGCHAYVDCGYTDFVVDVALEEAPTTPYRRGWFLAERGSIGSCDEIPMVSVLLDEVPTVEDEHGIESVEEFPSPPEGFRSVLSGDYWCFGCSTTFDSTVYWGDHPTILRIDLFLDEAAPEAIAVLEHDGVIIGEIPF